MNVFFSLESHHRAGWTILGFLLIPLIGFLDHLTGPEITFYVIFLLPIAIVAWFSGRRLALISSGLTVAVWILTDLSSGRFEPGIFAYLWNFGTRLAVLLIVAFLVSSLRRALAHERELARTDSLTGALNTRAFEETAQNEIARSERYAHPLTVAYIDIDDFKTINDSFGHSAGDKFLGAFVDTIRAVIRRSDSLARLGGDEFALLFPEADPESARTIVEKIRLRLTRLTVQNNWSITFSIGVVTFIRPPDSVDKMIDVVDRVMFSVKNAGKNDVEFIVV